MILLAAAVPVLLGTLLLVGLRWPAARAMPACAAVTGAIVLAVWRVPPLRAAAAALEAAIITGSVLLILFGALLLMEEMKTGGALDTLRGWFARRSADRRIQAVIVAWLLGSFLEGAAGFGTPAAVTGPLLVALGFHPVTAVALALIGDSVAVSFGAAGTPVLVGLEQGLAAEADPHAQALAAARRIAVHDAIVGPVVPLALVLTLTVGASGRHGWAAGLRAAPFALAVGIAHTATAAVVAAVAGPELPSLGGPLVGLAVALLLLARGWLVPREVWTWPLDEGQLAVAAHTGGPSPARAALPYVVLIALLVVTRARWLGLGPLLAAIEVGSHDLLGTGIGATVRPLHSPFAVFVVAAVGARLVFRPQHAPMGRSLRVAAAGTLRVALPLVAALVTVRLFIHSGLNARGLPAMPVVLATDAAAALGAAWPLVAPWVGALGAFIAGSGTFSNMLFAGIQHDVALARGWDPTIILALQGQGAAAGNMIAIHNVVAATAVVGLRRSEGDVIRRTFVAMLVYVVLAGGVGWLLHP